MAGNKVAWFGVGLLAVAGLVGIATKDSWDWILDGDPENVEVSAPTLDADPDTERLFRIVPDAESTASYAVEERLAGTTKTAQGSTSVLAGDIAVNHDDPAKSRMGEIVVNLEALRSDSTLRDKRIRHDFLQSGQYPYARFTATKVSGLPASVDDEAELRVVGKLTIREITKRVTFRGSARLDGDRLLADLSGELKMSDFGVGPIHVAGLAHTSDEVEFGLTIDAPEVESSDGGAAELALTDEAPDFPTGEFAGTVQPVLEQRCVGCHGKGRAGASTVLIDTAGDAAEIADDLAFVTESRYMPPWPASKKSLAFQHDYSMSDEEIATIRTWAEDGGGLDVPAGTKLTATAEPFDPIERDQVVPQKGIYVGDLAKKDDYRCFVHEFEDEGKPGEWVTGIGFEPDKTDVVHHSIIYKVPASARAEVESLDGSDGKPGWECFGLSNLKSPGVQTIGGWAPGQQPRVYPDGVGLYFQPGDMIVNQIHYHFDDQTPPDRSTLVFDTVSDEELAARKSPMTHITGNTYLTPAEGPCTPREKGPLCDRDAALDQIAEKYDAFARVIPDALIRGCGGDIEDFNQLDGTKFRSVCDMQARDVGTLSSVLGHMHEFGDSYRMTLNPDTPDERILLDIPSWSFEWQLYYEPKATVQIEQGDVIRFECTWDRTNAPMPEPRYITWNEGTVDEMCFSSVSVIPHTDTEGNPNAYAS